MTTADIGESRHLAARVAGCADLLDIRLFAAGADLTSPMAPDTQLASDLEVSPALERQDETTFVAALQFKVVITKADDKSEVASAQCDFRALYELPEGKDLSDDELEAFVRSVAMLAIYPYARELVQSLTSRMGLPPLVLPILRQPLMGPLVEALPSGSPD